MVERPAELRELSEQSSTALSRVKKAVALTAAPDTTGESGGAQDRCLKDVSNEQRQVHKVVVSQEAVRPWHSIQRGTTTK